MNVHHCGQIGSRLDVQRVIFLHEVTVFSVNE